MRTFKSLAAAGGLTVIAAVGLVASGTPQTTAAGVRHPCPSGMVCIYKGTSDTSSIIHGYYTLGQHYIHLNGKHFVANKLWDHRRVTFKHEKKGKGKTIAVLKARRSRQVDFTRVRSLVLQTTCPVKTCFTKIPQ